MPSASVANFENEDLLSARILSFMANNDTVSIGYDGSGYNNGTKFVPSTGFGSPGGSFENSDAVGSHNLRSPLHRNGSTPAMISLQDRVINGSTSDAFFPSHSTGFISGSCTPPPTVHPVSSVSTNFLPIRNQHGAPPYSALTSPCLGSKLNPGSGVTQLLSYSNSVAPNECHSLQNSPFYNHYPINGMQAQLHRQLGGISPNPIGTLLPNGVGGLGPAQNRTGLYQDGNFSLSGNLRSLNLGTSNSNCPQRELFPTSHQSGAQSIFGSGLLIQDRLHYYSLAQKQGYIVGAELERVKENSCRSTSQSYGRIAAHFRHRYGETEAKTKAAYLQIGVRVPSKDHVSEIVGKGGQKIKLIREETGALITTPGEHEEHVFIIEAPPEIAMRVAHHLTTRAQEITQSKLAAGERRRGSSSSQPPGGLDPVLSPGVFNNSPISSLVTANNPPPSTLLSLSHSCSNSPLHPTVNALNTLMSTAAHSNTNSGGGGTALRSPTGSLFSSHLSSLPSSPCNSLTTNPGGSMNTTQGNLGSTGGPSGLFLSNNPSSSSSSTPGSRILLARSRISVPQEMVGKIIGTQGSIITTIQKDTGTEIKSPPKEAARGPNATSEFEISAYQGLGLSSNQAAECRVQQAKQLIGHLVMRQLERRASGEVDESSSNLGSDEQRLNGGNNTRVSNATWMWPDVAQMDSQEAREVLDRILAESKNKTRRAKELAAAAAAGSSGPSPTSNGHNLTSAPTGMLNLSPVIGGGALGQEHRHHQLHFRTQLMGASGLFVDSPDPNECAGDFTSHLGDSVAPGLFNTQVTSFTNRASSTIGLLDDIHHSDGHCGTQPCSPHPMPGHNLHDHSDLSAPFSRIPGNPNMCPVEFWNPLVNLMPPLGHHSALLNTTTATTEPPGPTCPESTLSALLLFPSSSSSSVASAAGSTVTVVSSGYDSAGLLEKQTSLTNGFHGVKSNFEEPCVFNFNDSGNGLSSGFASGGDLSPTLLMQYRSHPPLDLLHQQPLTRRHSDWVVNSTNPLLDPSGSRLGGSGSQQLPSPLSFGRLGVTTETRETNSSPFTSSGGFDFLKALNQLCIHSNSGGLSGNGPSAPVSTSAQGTSTNAAPQYPPGFESIQHQQLSSVSENPLFPPLKTDDLGSGGDTACITSLNGPWSNNGCTSTSIFMPSHGSLAQHDFTAGSDSLPKTSLLQRLFSSPQSGSLLGDIDAKTATQLNAIWSPSATGDLPSSDDHLYAFPSYIEAAASALVDIHDDPPSSKRDLSLNSSSDTFRASSSPIDSSARCGAIGEGRRRRRGVSSPSLPNDHTSLGPITSVPSTVASITEVA